MAKTEKLVERAREHLDGNESVHAAVSGSYEIERFGQNSVRKGIFMATDTRLVFYAKKLFGYELEVFPFSNISSVEVSKGMLGHTISCFASGNKIKMKWIQRQDEAVKNLVNFVRDHIGKK